MFPLPPSALPHGCMTSLLLHLFPRASPSARSANLPNKPYCRLTPAVPNTPPLTESTTPHTHTPQLTTPHQTILRLGTLYSTHTLDPKHPSYACPLSAINHFISPIHPPSLHDFQHEQPKHATQRTNPSTSHNLSLPILHPASINLHPASTVTPPRLRPVVPRSSHKPSIPSRAPAPPIPLRPAPPFLQSHTHGTALDLRSQPRSPPRDFGVRPSFSAFRRRVDHPLLAAAAKPLGPELYLRVLSPVALGRRSWLVEVPWLR
jgi:hypothetical protein